VPVPAPPSGREVGEAYDAIAADYDRLVAEDRWMRELLWAHYRRLWRAGDRVLDVACGTGLDTLFLAGRGVRMTGIDVSRGMIARLREKAERQGLAERIDARALDAAELSSLPAAGFDGLLSAFAGLNTVDLAGFAAAAARLLRPGGRAVLHLLAPAGVWSRLGRLARLDWRLAGELGRRRERAAEISGQQIRHALLPAGETYSAFFASRFRLRRAYALGFLWPQPAGRRLPAGLARQLGRLEPRLGAHRPFLGWGRFFVLDLERRTLEGESAL